ncbi:MAG: cysteine methyltransferase [Archangium gephyra]|uniref:Methylated-DNA--protein-cysteine methyltransferase n=1 Tax=Archangium gephyra TaxID=48 RepID=A0A2W5STW2_9BACT|nr:MAG: cysteine methyltransferase [Archangium gephyra]
MAYVTSYTRSNSPVGPWLLVSDGEGLTGMYPESHRAVPEVTAGWKRDDAFFAGVLDQVRAYFAGHLSAFNVPLTPRGTPFQRKVWTALTEIPLGCTTTYGALAAHLGQVTASRAVGAANGKNPISLIVPCHRVIGAAGDLTGYAGGLQLKQWLLDHEASMARRGKGGVTPLSLRAVTRHSAQLTLA